MDQKIDIENSSAPPTYHDSNKQYPAHSMPTAPLAIIEQPPLVKGQINSNGFQPSNLAGDDGAALSRFMQRLDASKDLVIEQKYQLVEMLGWLRENKFHIWRDLDSAPFHAREDSTCWCRHFCGNRRSFQTCVKDGHGNILLKVERPVNLSMFCGILFPDSLVIKLGDNQVIGFVKEKVNFIPHFAIKNPQGKTMFELKARLLPCTFHKNDKVQFKVIDHETQRTVAKIVKHWGGCCQEYCTNADKYTIQFGDNWTPEVKALLMGTMFLINMRHFEECCGFFQKICICCLPVQGSR